MAPLTDANIDGLDGLIIGGGDHIGAEHYNGKPMPGVRIDRERDRLELKLLREAIPRNLPVPRCANAQYFTGRIAASKYPRPLSQNAQNVDSLAEETRALD